MPAILEYIPYRKDDATAVRDAAIHPYFAGHGYAAVRVDMRGSGDSDGILEDEYLPQEQDDGVEVIAWLAAQPWCTGAVGMIGKSWGGFNGLQIAAHAAARAEGRRHASARPTTATPTTSTTWAAACSAADMLAWASTMLAYQRAPAGSGRRGRALARAVARAPRDARPPFIEAWLSHQRRDAYWQHGSVCEDFAAIDCARATRSAAGPTATRTRSSRLLAGLSCPRKGLIGPWGHHYPHDGVPGPAIGFLQECLRWWDHWLKGEDTGVMDEPMLRVWMQESVAPRPVLRRAAGPLGRGAVVALADDRPRRSR